MINEYSEFKSYFCLTHKGYKIPFKTSNESNELLTKLINQLKKDLMVMPYTENPVRFPVFRISDKFLYIPKYYGINKFGFHDSET